MFSEFISSMILAVIQGTTEWLPISSSGHLVLFRSLLQNTGGLFLDVSLHFGTLMAVFVYFGKDILDIIRDVLSGKWGTENGKLGFYIIVATIPAALVGFFLRNLFEETYDNLWLLALGFAITSVTLFIASMDNTIKKFKKD